MLNPRRYYDLERYLFEDVHRNFAANGEISAFDFFSIVMWKANRAKSKIAARLLAMDPKGRKTLNPIVRELARSLSRAPDARERLNILVNQWGFGLPMASAVLSVFWPEEFTIYDVRVCERLNKFADLINATKFATIWASYQEYVDAVRAAVPDAMSLRDKDRWLWAKSTANQLDEDIRRCFQT